MILDGQTPRLRLLITLIPLVLASTIAAADDIPESMKDLVMGARHRTVSETLLDGARYESLSLSADVPYLLWPKDGAVVPYERDAAAEWVRKSAGVLGHRDFRPRYRRSRTWRGNEVWVYGLERQGIELYDAQILLHWRGQRFVGFVNDIAAPIVDIAEVESDGSADVERVYLPRRTGDGYALELAEVQRHTTDDRIETELVIAGKTVQRIVEPLGLRAPASAGFQEWPLPLGVFPDQIDVDSTGLVWFSQPNDDWVTSLDPSTGAYTQYDTLAGSSPDGMLVGAGDTLWTGLYGFGSGLGKFDITSSTFTRIPPPYGSAQMAIPTETSGGTIWVTDHQQNRISEYDPVSETWLQSLVLPTPSCWVVAGAEDTVSRDVYFTEYNSDQLARKSLLGPIVEIAAPVGSRPAFITYWDGVVYFSQWSRGRLGAYDIATGMITEFVFPEPDESGGPIDVTPSGLVVVGTRDIGYIMVFDPFSENFSPYRIPTADSGLKDGIRCDENGRIWFTESFGNKVAVLDLGTDPPVTDFIADPVSGTSPLIVHFTDLSTNLPTTWSWSFGDDGTSSLPNPWHTYLEEGLYTVALTSTNQFGSSNETKIDYISVESPCPIGPADLFISGRRSGVNIIFDWSATPGCRWNVHRSTDPEGILLTAPIANLVFPTYWEATPPEALVFYNVAPTADGP